MKHWTQSRCKTRRKLKLVVVDRILAEVVRQVEIAHANQVEVVLVNQEGAVVLKKVVHAVREQIN